MAIPIRGITHLFILSELFLAQAGYALTGGEGVFEMPFALLVLMLAQIGGPIEA